MKWGSVSYLVSYRFHLPVNFFVHQVFHMRHKYHQTMMHYIISLNTLQLKRKFALIEPFIGFIQSSKELYKLGIENLLTNEELDGFCENINASVQTVHQVVYI